MRIDPTHAARIAGIMPRSAPAPTQPAGEGGPSRRLDSVNLSEGLGRLREAHAAAAEASDVRAERVAEIKAQIQAGAYTVDTDALAEKMLGHL